MANTPAIQLSGWRELLMLLALGGCWSMANAQLPKPNIPGVNSKKVIEYYTKDSIRIHREYWVLTKKPNVLDGPYMVYYENGNPQQKGGYKHGKKFGAWKYYYENGNPKMQGQMTPEGPTGHWTYYYENGNPRSEGRLNQEGKKTGAWKNYYESGSLKSKGQMQNGQQIGEWRYYYENGSLKSITYYHRHDYGRYKGFYPSGALKAKGIIVDGQSDSTWRYYYENGQLKAKGPEEDGVKDGQWQFYHPDGTLAAEGQYDDGVEEGHWRYFHENGKVSSEGVLENGEKDGDWKLYYEDGDLLGEGSFNNGNGTYKEYYENGKLKMKGRLKNGDHEGEWKYYYEDGILEGRCDYENGRGHYIGYYKNGKKRIEGTLVNGKRVGTMKMYKPNGAFAGYYKSINDKEVPIFDHRRKKDRPEEEKEQKKLNPELIMPPKTPRYFKPKVNEVHAFILGGNPLAPILGTLPLSAEYYMEERLGYQLIYTHFRDPFFRGINQEENTLYRRGGSLAFRQKFYHPRSTAGYLYFGHELRAATNLFSSSFRDSSSHQQTVTNLTDASVAYSVLAGSRVISKIQDGKAFTFDVFAGFGVGYSFYRAGNFSEQPGNIYSAQLDSRFHFPVRMGFTLGYYMHYQYKK